MNAKERYFWDLTGYLVLRNVLSQDELKAANDALDHYANHIEAGSQRQQNPELHGTGRLGLRDYNVLQFEKPYCDPFRNMLAHPKIVSHLKVMCGDGFRLDHGPQFIGGVNGTAGGTQHGSGDPHKPWVGYHHQNGNMYVGGVTVTWNLTDADPGVGGFGCVAGSHKSKYPMPSDVRYQENKMGCVSQVPMKGGDVLFFMDGAQTHGTMPWKADHMRRTILFKFAGRTSARSGPASALAPPETYWDHEVVDNMTDEQKAVMWGPYSNYRDDFPILTVTEDGVVQIEF
jgi:ectoine hydroxylase-related dioxygenase (phytanoyl-CoA dioxygenase family)